MPVSSPDPGRCRPRAPSVRYLPPAARAVVDLGGERCRWPIGEPDDETFAFCGGAHGLTSSYCANHARLARVRRASPGASR